ncbi:MAG: RES family NAD+ phosphorylase [Hyphomicrobiales bacterium]|nr:RES family NAD+ phosphorylase [Hyphomicrobiales bacterium]MBV8826721.1 RES family NAD+ phosphorylase [Hyphomicrobiales bacterium]MBV9427850.1 RES family NAD+ phosphorylase [Bradyrhizobiaceae bacterium]
MRCAAGSRVLEYSAYVRRITQDRTIRLVATARLRDPVLRKLVEEADLAALAEIEGATSARLRAQAAGAERLDRRELVYGVAHAHFINAAFAYFMPRSLNRFNGPGRGAWYAALALDTCVAEVAFHMERELANIADFNATVDYAELYASFIGDFVDLREAKPRPEFLDADPNKSYAAGNAFADAVRTAGYYGIVYPSARHSGGTCLVALVPHAVQSVAQGAAIRLAWTGRPGPRVSQLGAGFTE